MNDDLFAPPPRRAEIILLDYQCTLCANGHLRQQWLYNPANRNRSYAEWISGEVMRDWIIPLCAGRKVILITARKRCWEEVTLKRIAQCCSNWQPDEWFFNPDGAQPPEHKDRVLRNHIFPRFGTPEKVAYLALESNRMTRAMYNRHGITAVRVEDPLDALPDC